MKKKKKHTSEAQSPYKTVKTSLKSVLLDCQNIQPEINKLVIKCNDIVIQTYQFIRLYILNKYHKKLDVPKIDEKFISYCLRTQGTRDNRGKHAKDDTLLKELNDFYDKEYQPLIKKEKLDLKCFSYLLPYLAIQINTSYQNNIKEHYGKHLLRFINKTTTWDKETRNKIKKAVINQDETELSKDYLKWYNKHSKHIIPENINKSVAYDVKVNPNKYIKCLIYMNGILEKESHKLFQPLPLRNNIVPKYITIDTACLINLFASKGKKGKLLQSLKNNKGLIWNQIFKLDKKVFKDKNYQFNYQIQTDGIGISLSFIRNDLVDKKYGTKTSKIEEDNYRYIEDLTRKELTEYNKKNIVGVDPGKKWLVYMVDDNNNTLRYSAPQKRTESMARRNNKILIKEKKYNNIIDLETKLSEQNSKTINYTRFKKYIRDKTKLNDKTRAFYIKDVWRKMKWRQYVYSRKSEDNLLNKISETFGKDCILAYGDWSRTTQMTHFMPTKNKGLRKIIHKRFKTISINEFNTSKNCCECYNKLEYVNNKTIRLLKCSKCLSSENKKTVFRTRDSNSAINIKNLFRYYCKYRKRPKEFIRSSSVSKQSKVEQSVDFTEGNASN